MRAGGHCTASLDIRLGEARPGKQNAYDLLSDPGFAFLWLQVDGMEFMVAFQISSPKDMIYLGCNLLQFGGPISTNTVQTGVNMAILSFEAYVQTRKYS